MKLPSTDRANLGVGSSSSGESTRSSVFPMFPFGDRLGCLVGSQMDESGLWGRVLSWRIVT